MKDSLKDTAIAQVRQDDASPRQAPGEVTAFALYPF